MWWVEFDTNQTLPWLGWIGARDGWLARYVAQASFMSAAMPVRGDFYYFILTLLRLEYGSCVQKKGHDGNAEKRHGKFCRGK